MKTGLVKTVALYGILLAGLAYVLSFVEFKFLMRDLSVEFYVGVVAFVFTALGVWMGSRLVRNKGEPIVQEPTSPHGDDMYGDIPLRTNHSPTLRSNSPEERGAASAQLTFHVALIQLRHAEPFPYEPSTEKWRFLFLGRIIVERVNSKPSFLHFVKKGKARSTWKT